MLMDTKFSHRAGDNPLSALRARCRDHEEFITACFVPTDKNSPASSFLADEGFRHVAGYEWRISLDDVPMLDPSIQKV
jgi:hypothetical protein